MEGKKEGGEAARGPALRLWFISLVVIFGLNIQSWPRVKKKSGSLGPNALQPESWNSQDWLS